MAGTTADKLALAASNKAAIKAAIEAKSPATAPTNVMSQWPTAIASIPTASAPVIQPLSVTANGTYSAPSGVDGYSPVTVSVAGTVDWDEIVGGTIRGDVVTTLATIPENAMFGKKFIASVSAPNCTTVANQAFCNCFHLRSVSLPVATKLQMSAFNSAGSQETELTVSIPKVNTLEAFVFAYSSVTSLRLPSVKGESWSMNNSTLSFTSKLTEIHFAAAYESAIRAHSGFATLWGHGAGTATVTFDL